MPTLADLIDPKLSADFAASVVSEFNEISATTPAGDNSGIELTENGLDDWMESAVDLLESERKARMSALIF
jgi:hypothetical protein